MTELYDNSPFDLSKMIAEVEGYVGLPAGTIKPFFSAGEEWVFVLKIASIVETVLKSAIIARVESNAATTTNPFARALMGATLSAPLRTHILRIPIGGDIGAIALAQNFDLLNHRDSDFVVQSQASEIDMHTPLSIIRSLRSRLFPKIGTKIRSQLFASG